MQEIDYTMEGESADRFRKNFGTEDWLKVPGIFWERTTSEVLTMEYCPGVKINRISELDKLGVNRKRLAKLAVESYLQQILTYGFFHAGKARARHTAQAYLSMLVIAFLAHHIDRSLAMDSSASTIHVPPSVSASNQ